MAISGPIKTPQITKHANVAFIPTNVDVYLDIRCSFRAKSCSQLPKHDIRALFWILKRHNNSHLGRLPSGDNRVLRQTSINEPCSSATTQTILGGCQSVAIMFKSYSLAPICIFSATRGI